MSSDEKKEENNSRSSSLKYVFFGGAGLLFVITILLFGVAASIIFCPDSVLSRITLSFLQSSTGEQAQQGTITNARGFLVSTAGTLGSLAVSLALTGVYLSQNNIMQDQVETQTKQLRSMRQEKLPLLGVHEGGVELHDTKPVVENTDDSSLEVSDGEEGCWASVAVENHGDEIAQQVHMACLIDFPEIADKPPLVSGFCAMESTKTVTDSPVGNGALVSSETGLVLLRGMPRLRENTPHGFEKTTFRDKITTQLLEEKRTVRFGFVLIYTNSMEQTFRVALSSRTAKPENFDSYDKTDVTSDILIDRSTEYRIQRLIEESGWEMPKDVFVPHDQHT
jgi:hypothetical protein